MMSWLKNRSIGAKLAILAGIPMVVLIILTVISYRDSMETNADFVFAYENFTKPTIEIALMRANLQAAQKDVLKIIINKDEKRYNEVNSDLLSRRAENVEAQDRVKK
ncbi:MAG: MCP four helix bundle domain-containing protein, partial [Synergistaceae bacterium]|nr:MCP four helix bundle domain-containing protein [Synergistaceae bacterium]